jgi:hypothetical protein
MSKQCSSSDVIWVDVIGFIWVDVIYAAVICDVIKGDVIQLDITYGDIPICLMD